MRSDPSNPEAALIPTRRERPSLDWIRFAIEELTSFSSDSSFDPALTRNGTRILFYQLAITAGYDKKEVSDSMGNHDPRFIGWPCSKKNALKLSPELLEAWFAIEKMILARNENTRKTQG